MKCPVNFRFIWLIWSEKYISRGSNHRHYVYFRTVGIHCNSWQLICVLSWKKKKKSVPSGSWEEVVMLWAEVTTKLMTTAHSWRSRFHYELCDTNARVAVVYRRRFPNRPHPGVSARSETPNHLHATPTDDQHVLPLHCIQRLIASHSNECGVRSEGKLNSGTAATFLAGWSTTCVDDIPRQTIKYPTTRRCCMWFLSTRHSFLEMVLWKSFGLVVDVRTPFRLRIISLPLVEMADARWNLTADCGRHWCRTN